MVIVQFVITLNMSTILHNCWFSQYPKHVITNIVFLVFTQTSLLDECFFTSQEEGTDPMQFVSTYVASVCLKWYLLQHTFKKILLNNRFYILEVSYLLYVQ